MANPSGIILVSLGPGNPGSLTLEARDILEQAGEVFVRTLNHPVISLLPDGENQISFISPLEERDSPQASAERIAARVLDRAARQGSAVYASPGHVLLDDTAGALILQRARAEGMPVRVVEGVSLASAALAALEAGPMPEVFLVEANELAGAHVPSYPTGTPALITRLQNRDTLSGIEKALRGLFPAEHRVRLVRDDEAQKSAEELSLEDLAGVEEVHPLDALYVPPLDKTTSFEAFLEVIARLRAPDGCPWDREQTHQSLRGSLLEETYEALQALDEQDLAGMEEEFGDLLLLILMQAQIAAENGEFTIADVLSGIHNKIVRRHPHVFGDEAANDAKTVLANWERLKAEERAAHGNAEASLLDSVNTALPALGQAEQYQKRAARVGFDWKAIEPVREKIDEEMAEVEAAETHEELASELGDLLFAVVNLARWHKVDPESALRETNQRFRQRFREIEKAAREQGRAVSDLSLDEMESLWQQAKQNQGKKK